MREPIAILAAVRAVLVLLTGFGIVRLSDLEVEQVLTGLATTYATIEVLITAIQRRKVTPVAGPAKATVNQELQR